MSTVERPERADAARNRQRILDAAAELFAARGLDVPMDDIADAAGVGVGTVYRRFGDRTALVEALFEAKVARVVALAEAGLAVEDPWEGLRTFLVETAELHAQDRGLKDALLSSGRGSEAMEEAREKIRPLARRLVDRAREAGVLREDFAVFDLPVIQFAVGAIADRTRHAAPDYHRRIVTLLLDGMVARRDGVTPMPAAPLTKAGFDGFSRPC